MSLLAPYMLWGSLAASIPIILHFFYRSRFRDVPWAAMKFLRTAMEQTAQRLKFQELLLLILRVCLLLLLALALSRITFSSTASGGLGDAVDAVVILDTSLSMQAKAGAVPPGGDEYRAALRSFADEEGVVTCLGRAQAAAIRVVENLPAHSTVRVIAASGKADSLGPRNPGHLDQAAELIRGVKASEQGADLVGAMAEAEKYLRSSPSPNKEVYLFSDMQKTELEAKASDLTEQLKALTELARVHFVRCPSEVKRNIAIAGITPQTTLRSKERADFAVLVRNAGKERVTNLTVSLSVDGNEDARETQALPEIGPGETRAVVLRGMLKEPGRHVLSATVKPDDLAGDNSFQQVVFVNDQVGILVVDGTPDIRDPRRSATYFLMHAINPTVAGATGLPVTVVPIDRAQPNDLQAKELCVLVNVRLEGKDGTGSLSGDFVRALGPFVESGKGLMIIAGPRTDIAAHNKVLFERMRLLPYPMERLADSPKDRGWRLDRTTAEQQPFVRFRDEKGYAGVGKIEARRLVQLKEEGGGPQLAEESRVLMRYVNGMPAIASRKRPGQGEVMLFTTAMHETARDEKEVDWSNWHLSLGMVPFVQVAVNHLVEGRPGEVNRVAGQSLVYQVPRGEEETTFDLIGPDGERKRLPVPVSSQGRYLVTATDTPRAGLYTIVGAGREPEKGSPLFAVTPLLSETEDLTAMGPAEVDRTIGAGAIHLTADNDGAEFSGAERLKREWTTWLLVALLVLLLGEMALAWYCGRAW
jgi:hypothetical protein